MEAYTIAGIITICSSLMTFYLAFYVGAMRRKHASSVLKKTKQQEVIVANRVHMNMIEISVVYLPLLWVGSMFGPTTIIGIIGTIWFLSRVWYSIAYLKNPSSRTIPFIVGVLCIAVTALLGLYGLVL